MLVLVRYIRFRLIMLDLVTLTNAFVYIFSLLMKLTAHFLYSVTRGTMEELMCVVPALR